MVHNDYYFEIGLLFIGFIIVGGILLSPILGRFWCGWLCPRGTFLEYLLEKVSQKRTIPDILRSKTFKLFIASILAVMFAMVLLDLNPAAYFPGWACFTWRLCVHVHSDYDIDIIPLGIIYMPRTWCGFCPVGYAQSLLSKNKILKISIEDCKNCKKCHSSCNLDLCRTSTGKSKTMESPDCMACMKCTDSCKIGANKPMIMLKAAWSCL